MATYTTGGNLPPNLRTMQTGGNHPAIPLSTPVTGGPLPATPVTPASTPAPNVGAGGNIPKPANPQPNSLGMVQNAIGGILNPNGQYIQNARQYGLDHSRSRGLVNSSIAAGNSQRAAIDAALPLAQEVLGIDNRREGQNFQRLFQHEGADLSRRNSLDVASANARLTDWLSGNTHNRTLAEATHGANLTNWLGGENHVRNLAQMGHQAGLQDWLSNQSFTREFNGALSMLPIMNSFQMLQQINEYALSDPETYPPAVVTGLTNFLNQNMFSILREYFPNLVQPAGGT